MIKVSLIYSKNLSDQTGASAVMRTIYDSKSLFRDYGVELNVYSRELHKKGSVTTNTSNPSKWKFKRIITNTLQLLSKEIPICAYALNYIKSMRPAKHMVSYMNGKIGEEDILFFHELYTAYYYLKKYGKKNKAVFVIHNDGRDFYLESIRYKHFNNSIYHKKLKKMLQFVIETVDRVGYVSAISVDNFLCLHPDFPQEKLFVAYNGLPGVNNPNVFHKEYHKYQLVCVGTVIVSKGQQFIIEALKKMKETKVDISKITCTFVGGGPNLVNLEEYVKQNGLSDIIYFVGPTNNVAKYLIDSNIFVLPSTSEGLPMSILEAMRAGLPIVSTKVGGVPETIKEGVSGLIIDSSTEGVYNWLCRIDDYDWQEMATESYKYYLEKFTVDSMVNSYSDVFKTI